MGSNSGYIRNLSDTLKRNVWWRSGCEHSVITRGFHFRNRVLLTLILGIGKLLTLLSHSNITPQTSFIPLTIVVQIFFCQRILLNPGKDQIRSMLIDTTFYFAV